MPGITAEFSALSAIAELASRKVVQILACYGLVMPVTVM